MVINSAIGLVALIVVLLTVVQSIRRWRELAYIVADLIVSFAEGVDNRFGDWLYRTGRWTAERRFLRLFYNPLFQFAWLIEEFVRDHSISRRTAYLAEYAAASPVGLPDVWDDDFIEYEDDDWDEYDRYREDVRSVDDYRYDY